MTQVPVRPEVWSKRRQNRFLPTLRPRKSLATFYHQATPATVYWRCELPAKHLSAPVLEATSLRPEILEDNSITFPGLSGDAAIVQFPGDNGSAVMLMALQSQGKKFLVEVDDYYLDEEYDPTWHSKSGWANRIGQGAHSKQGHTWISHHASGVIVTTETLAEAYRKVNDNVFVCRNSIDPSDWPELEKPDDGVFRIGWYASGSHSRDESMCRQAMSWASRQPGVEIVTIGINPPWNFTRYWIGWKEDWKEQRPELMKLDVGVSPLVGTPLTRYRSDLKALEYAMAGVMPILQAYPPYEEWRDKPFARMCWTEKDWMDAIKWAVRNQDEVRARALEAREYVLQERTFKTEIEKWKAAINAC